MAINLHNPALSSFVLRFARNSEFKTMKCVSMLPYISDILLNKYSIIEKGILLLIYGYQAVFYNLNKGERFFKNNLYSENQLNELRKFAQMIQIISNSSSNLE